MGFGVRSMARWFAVISLAVTMLGCTPHGAFESCVAYRPSHCNPDERCRMELEFQPDHTATVRRSGDEFDAFWSQGRSRSGHAEVVMTVPEIGVTMEYLLDPEDRTLSNEYDWLFEPGDCD